jgi:predicted regulator of Ras-like GTPase activity (Roadblock/LC7/MglB family)
MGFDGITVDSFARSGYDGALPDIQTLAMEFAHLIAQARRTLMSLDAGALEEFTLRAEALTLIVRVLTQEYFLACAILPAGSVGKARYLMRMTAPALRADL